MKFIGSAAVVAIVLWSVDELFNDARFTRMAIVVLRQALGSIGFHSSRLSQVQTRKIGTARGSAPACTNAESFGAGRLTACAISIR
jgi:hypothetical protein